VRQLLAAYTARVGVSIDWTVPEIATDGGERVETFWDPEAGLNASASLVFRDGILVRLRFSMAL
jgi:hypothetical protein